MRKKSDEVECKRVWLFYCVFFVFIFILCILAK